MRVELEVGKKTIRIDLPSVDLRTVPENGFEIVGSKSAVENAYRALTTFFAQHGGMGEGSLEPSTENMAEDSAWYAVVYSVASIRLALHDSA
jgi:hypothetical protein